MAANQSVEGTADKLRLSVPYARRTPAAPHVKRWASADTDSTETQSPCSLSKLTDRAVQRIINVTLLSREDET